MKKRLASLLSFILILSLSSTIIDARANVNIQRNISSYGNIQYNDQSGTLRGVNVACLGSRWEGWDIKAELVKLKGYGFNAIRYHSLYWRDVTPDSYDQIDETIFTGPTNRAAPLDDWVRWCDEAGLYIMIDLAMSYWEQHPDWAFPGESYSRKRFWDLMMSGQAPNELQSIKNIWSYVSDRYKDEDHVIFDIWNEPFVGEISQSTAASNYKAFAEDVIDIIRSRENFRHVIVVEYYIMLDRPDNIVGDDRIYRSLHWYDPWEQPYDQSIKDHNEEYFSLYVSRLKSTGLKVISGEFGRVLYPTPHGGSVEWLEDAFELFRKYGLEGGFYFNYAHHLDEPYSIINPDGTPRQPYFDIVVENLRNF